MYLVVTCLHAPVNSITVAFFSAAWKALSRSTEMHELIIYAYLSAKIKLFENASNNG